MGKTINAARKQRNQSEKSRLARVLGAMLLIGMETPLLMAAPAATTTTLAVTAKGLSVSSVDAGAVVTLTAMVETGGKPLALGQVNFCDATAPICSDPVTGDRSSTTRQQAIDNTSAICQRFLPPCIQLTRIN